LIQCPACLFGEISKKGQVRFSANADVKMNLTPFLHSFFTFKCSFSVAKLASISIAAYIDRLRWQEVKCRYEPYHYEISLSD
jgi:hypothetical protein